MKYLLLFFTYVTFAQSQKFIPLDEDTLEFIDQANYTLYSNKKSIFTSLTSKDSITQLPKEIVFDSISFTKSNYESKGFKKENFKEVVYLKKTAFELDEIIISNSKQNEIVIGEKARFVKKHSNSIIKDTEYGLLFRESDLKNKQIEGLHFYVEKVKYKTTYKIKFYAANEIGNFYSGQTLKLNELVFESPILIIEKGTKNKIEINLEEYNINTYNQDIFVCIELQDYYDENNNLIELGFKEATKLKFQLSTLTNYYAKTSDFYTKKMNDDFININAMINHDFAYIFFKKPPKSELVAPAIILYATNKKLSLNR